jgi:hypothetical protein
LTSSPCVRTHALSIPRESLKSEVAVSQGKSQPRVPLGASPVAIQIEPLRGCCKAVSKFMKLTTKQLTAINQYFIHSKMCENWGYRALAKKYYDASLGETKHALFLEGTPNMTRYDKIKVGDTVKSDKGSAGSLRD